METNKKILSEFDSLAAEVDKGMSGRNQGIPTGHERAKNNISIRQGIYTLIGGYTGSAKTTYVDDMFVLNPVDWYIKNFSTTKIRFKIIYRSMERSKKYKFARWVARKIFLDTGKIIPVGRLLGWWGEKLSSDEHDLFLNCREYIEAICEIVDIIDGAENPVGIAKHLKNYALSNGNIEDVDEYSKIYIPNDSNLITEVIIDHIGLVKTTKDHPSKKEAIDKLSDELRHVREQYMLSPVVIQQFNRSISNPIRLKNGDVSPNLEDFAESSQTQHDSDLVLALFDPMRYKVECPSGYDLNKLRDVEGGKRYRSLQILKSSYGPDQLQYGLALQPSAGVIRELPKKSEITDKDYQSVLDDSFFRRKKIKLFE